MPPLFELNPSYVIDHIQARNISNSGHRIKTRPHFGRRSTKYQSVRIGYSFGECSDRACFHMTYVCPILSFRHNLFPDRAHVERGHLSDTERRRHRHEICRFHQRRGMMNDRRQWRVWDGPFALRYRAIVQFAFYKQEKPSRTNHLSPHHDSLRKILFFSPSLFFLSLTVPKISHTYYPPVYRIYLGHPYHMGERKRGIGSKGERDGNHHGM